MGDSLQGNKLKGPPSSETESSSENKVSTSLQNPGSSAADIDSISEQMAKVRAAAFSLLGKAENASSVNDLAAAVEKVSVIM
ncbi:MAG: hypothetical protein JO138_07290 [Acidobacteriaceae bacterium]|nr:hypothetical protein [Acidobacteriaceae bacterium]